MGLFSSKPAAPAASDLRRERRALLLLREDRLRELGGLTLEMYRRDHFNEALIVERCAELVAIEARASEIDALLAGRPRPAAPRRRDLRVRRADPHRRPLLPELRPHADRRRQRPSRRKR